MSLQDSMFGNEPDRLRQARNFARAARHYLSAHSIMLSAYTTVLGGKPVERHHPVKFGLLALWHAMFLLGHWQQLNHNQLDVLVAFLIKLRKKKIPAWPFRPDLIDLSGREVELVEANIEAKPHQIALAYLTRAEAIHLQWGNRPETIQSFVTKALSFESAIRAEPYQPMGIRQLVRVYRKAGELSIAIGNRDLSIGFLKKALALAKGEANTPDQVEKIELLLPGDMN